MIPFKEKDADALSKVVTMGVLLEYTDDFLIPRFADIVDDRVKESEERTAKKMSLMEHNLKAYIDDKLADYTSDIFKRLDRRHQPERKFFEKIIELVKKKDFRHIPPPHNLMSCHSGGGRNPDVSILDSGSSPE